MAAYPRPTGRLQESRVSEQLHSAEGQQGAHTSLLGEDLVWMLRRKRQV